MQGTIYYDGSQLMFKDTSTNGTMINNVSVRHRAVPIRHGDIIMLAGRYQINWNQIDSFFPNMPQSSRPIETISDLNLNMGHQAAAPAPLDLSKWSWGAFVLSWIWGFFNGCWWMFLVRIGFLLLNALLWWVPFMVIIVLIADLCVSVLFGLKGTEWAWNNRSWNSVESFKHAQDAWNKIGLALFLLSIILTVLSVIFFFASISRLLYLL